jgi:hypothetical protein
MDEGSPGNDILVETIQKEPVGKYPGFWQMPVHPVIVPPDDKCEEYGVESGFRDRMAQVNTWWEDQKDTGKITGLDWNMIANLGGFEMNKEEFLATLKYTYDLRKKGNRAPFMLGAHSQFYADKWTSAPNIPSAEDRQSVIEDFLDYVLKDDFVKVVSIGKIMEWCKNPKPL